MLPGWMFSFWSISSKVIADAVKRFAGNEETVLVFTYPQYRSMLSIVQPELSIYYNLDNYADNWPRHAKVLSQWEEETVRRVDATVCIAQYRQQFLQRRVPEKAQKISHLPLGTTPDFMANSRLQHTQTVPDALKAIAHPRVGYIGALNRRFDYAFLVEVAQIQPEVQFILGGSVPTSRDGDPKWSAGFLQAKNLANVHFIGWVDHLELGGWLNAFDALFMCYSQCRFNMNASPAKLWDYLGTGLPIIASENNPETLLWRDFIYLGSTPSAFAAHISKALTENDPSSRKRRLDIAAAHTWDALAQRFQALVSESLRPQFAPTTA